MCATFTDDDIGKLVRTGSGEDVGVVAAVDGRTAHVSPVPMTGGSDPSTPSMATEADETRPIAADCVCEITDERVRLEGELSVPTETTGDDRTRPTVFEEDPTDELAEEATTDPGAKADPRALADRRTDAAVSADDEPRRTDAAVDPDDDVDRTDAEVDPDEP